MNRNNCTTATNSATEPPSGEQFEIRHGTLRAVVTEVGAGLRSLQVGDVQVLDTYERTEMPAGGRGQLLLPWPGRIEDGRYTFAGEQHQLPLDELEAHNAIHGLTRWANWRPVLHTASQLVMALTLHPQPGYPFAIRLQVSYTLTAARLDVTTTARNIGPTPLPFGAGHHPYFTVGTDIIDDAVLTVPAQSYFETTHRSIPVPPHASVAGTPFDFREPRPIGPVVLDTCYTDLIAENGWACVMLSAPRGYPTVAIMLDSAHSFLLLYTADQLADTSRRRRGIAIEPYTCAPNAFNNGIGLRTLQPQESFACTWSVVCNVQRN